MYSTIHCNRCHRELEWMEPCHCEYRPSKQIRDFHLSDKPTIFMCNRGRPRNGEPKYKCFNCGIKVIGRKALEDHKRDCLAKVEVGNPCTCFSKRFVSEETGIAGQGVCEQHEGDAG